MGGTRHQAPTDYLEGGSHGAAVCGRGGVHWDRLPDNQWDVPVRGPQRTTQNIVRHLFETCLPQAVFENRKEGAGLHTLKINALTTVTECHQVLLNGVATGMGELRAEVGLPPWK